MTNLIVVLVSTIANILTLIIILDALLSFFLSPFHPVREALGRVLQPVYAPIRKVVPPLGMLDLSPLIALILIQVLEQVIISLIR